MDGHIYKNQVFKNYKDLCYQLNLKVKAETGGSCKIRTVKKLSEIITFKRDGFKYIVVDFKISNIASILEYMDSPNMRKVSKTFKESCPEKNIYLLNEKDGEYSPYSKKMIYTVCPNCHYKNINKISLRQLAYTKSYYCEYCSVKNTFPERFLENILLMLNVEYQKEYSPKWANRKRYDFYIELLNMIIECHGLQHYQENNVYIKSLKEEKENDIYKKEIANNNGIIHYVEVNCSQSNKDFLKQNILESLDKYIDFSNINFNEIWIKCFSQREQDIYNDIKLGLETKDISNKYSISTNEVKAIILKMKSGNIQKKKNDIFNSSANPYYIKLLYDKLKDISMVSDITGLNDNVIKERIKYVDDNINRIIPYTKVD